MAVSEAQQRRATSDRLQLCVGCEAGTSMVRKAIVDGRGRERRSCASTAGACCARPAPHPWCGKHASARSNSETTDAAAARGRPSLAYPTGVAANSARQRPYGLRRGQGCRQAIPSEGRAERALCTDTPCAPGCWRARVSPEQLSRRFRYSIYCGEAPVLLRPRRRGVIPMRITTFCLAALLLVAADASAAQLDADAINGAESRG